MQRLFASAALCLLLAGAAVPAMAWDTQAEITHVRLNGVDFNDPAEVQALYSRLEKAASRVCDVAGHSIEVRGDNAECRARALDGAVALANKPGLSQLHAERTRSAPQLTATRRQRSL